MGRRRDRLARPGCCRGDGEVEERGHRVPCRRGVRLRRLPHGLLHGSRSKHGSCCITATPHTPTVRRPDAHRSTRVLSRTAPSRDDGGALALHGPQGLRPRLLRTRSRDSPWHRSLPGRCSSWTWRDLPRSPRPASQIDRAPEGITFAPLTEEHEKLYSLVGWDEKFAAHNAAVWEHGLLVVVPKGVELESRFTCA